MNKKRIILGLDISTACLGTSVVSYDGEETKVLYVHYVKMKQNKNYKGTDALFYKSNLFKETFIKDKVTNWGVTDIVIEEPLPSSQNSVTVNTLMKFNGMISQSIYEATGIIPKYISSYDARKYAFPELLGVRKYNKKDEMYSLSKYKNALKNNDLVLFGEYPFSCAKKYILWNKIVELYPDINWIYDKNDDLKTENFDASDSLVCVLGYINKLKHDDHMEPLIKDVKMFDKYIDYTIEVWGKRIDKRLNLE